MSKLSGSYASDAAPKPPSGVWHGALSTGLIFAGAAWILVYTLLDVPPVEALGAWNYVGVIGLIVVNTIVGRTWRGEAYQRPTHTSRV